MSEKNTDIELSVDELNKVSGSGGRKNISNGISAGAECDPDFISKGNVSFEKKGRKQTESLDTTQFGNGDSEHT